MYKERILKKNGILATPNIYAVMISLLISVLFSLSSVYFNNFLVLERVPAGFLLLPLVGLFVGVGSLFAVGSQKTFQSTLVFLILTIELFRVSFNVIFQANLSGGADIAYTWYSLRIAAVITLAVIILLLINLRREREINGVLSLKSSPLGRWSDLLIYSVLASAFVGLLRGNSLFLVINDSYKFVIMPMATYVVMKVDRISGLAAYWPTLWLWYIFLIVGVFITQSLGLGTSTLHHTGFLLPIAALLSYLLVYSEKQFMALLGLVVALIAILFSLSRGSWFAVIFMILSCYFFVSPSLLVRKTIRSVLLLSILLLAITPFSYSFTDTNFTGLQTAVERVEHRLFSVSDSQQSFGETAARTEEIRYALLQMSATDAPLATYLLGMGHGSQYFGLAITDFVVEGSRSLHFTPMAVFFRMGLLGVITFYGMVLSAMLWLYKLYQNFPEHELQKRLVVSSTLLYTVGLFIFSLRGYTFVGDVMWAALVGLCYTTANKIDQ